MMDDGKMEDSNLQHTVPEKQRKKDNNKQKKETQTDEKGRNMETKHNEQCMDLDVKRLTEL